MRLVPELCRGIGRDGRPCRSDLRTEAEGEGGLRGTGRDIRRTLASAFELEPSLALSSSRLKAGLLTTPTKTAKIESAWRASLPKDTSRAPKDIDKGGLYLQKY